MTTHILQQNDIYIINYILNHTYKFFFFTSVLKHLLSINNL